MNVEFQLARPDDLETLMPLMRAYYVYDHLKFEETKARRALLDLLEKRDFGLAWLIRVDGRTAGYMVVCFGYSLEFGGRDAFLDELYLEEALRGQGIGTQAIGHMIAACRSEQINALHLEVLAENASAIAFYKRLGFVYHENMLMSRYISLADESSSPFMGA